MENLPTNMAEIADEEGSEDSKTYEPGIYTGTFNCPGVGEGEYEVEVVDLTEEDEEVATGMHDSVTRSNFHSGQRVLRVKLRNQESSLTFAKESLEFMNDNFELSRKESEE